MFFLRSGIPFVRFLIVFMSGIAWAIAYKPVFHFTSLLYFFIGYGLVVLLERKYLWILYVKSILGYVVMFQLGVYVLMIRYEASEPNHFMASIDSIKVYEAKIIQMPEETEKTIKALLEVKQIKTRENWEKSSGKLIGYFPKTILYETGMVILIEGKPSKIRAADNPSQFDYKEYLERQNIYATHFIKEGCFKQIAFEKGYWLNDLASKFRNFCEERLKEGIENKSEYTIASALLLGVRGELDQDLYQAYSDTGTVHALAVSGMHVSLIYLFVVFFFGFVKRFQYGGRYLFALISLSVFWFYALVTGFSPSVVRAVTMFSVVVIAGLLKRNTGIYNTLAFSAFIILCIEPFWLMDIGFQFSFLAVLGIAYIYPILFESWIVSNKILEKIWGLVCVSISAQLAVAPLSIYYFHSFPLLFLPFNILIVPISTLAMYSGLSGLMVYKLNFLSDFLMLITDYILRVMNYIVLLPAQNKFLKLDFLSFTLLEVLLTYLALMFLFFAFKNRKIGSLRIFFFLSMLLIFSVLYSNFMKFNKKNFTLYKINGRTVFSIIHRGEADLYSNVLVSLNDKDIRYSVYNHFASLGVNNINNKNLNNAFLGNDFYCCSEGKLIVNNGLKIFLLDKAPTQKLNIDFLKRMDILIISNKLAYSYIVKNKTKIGAKILIDSSVKVYNNDEYLFYDVNKKGAYVYEWR